MKDFVKQSSYGIVHLRQLLILIQCETKKNQDYYQLSPNCYLKINFHKPKNVFIFSKKIPILFSFRLTSLKDFVIPKLARLLKRL